MNKENNEKDLPRFENHGSIKFLKEFDTESEKSRKIIKSSFIYISLVIIFSRIFNFISVEIFIMVLLIMVMIFVVASRIFKLLILSNLYTLTKISALQDEIK